MAPKDQELDPNLATKPDFYQRAAQEALDYEVQRIANEALMDGPRPARMGMVPGRVQRANPVRFTTGDPILKDPYPDIDPSVVGSFGQGFHESFVGRAGRTLGLDRAATALKRTWDPDAMPIGEYYRARSGGQDLQSKMAHMGGRLSGDLPLYTAAGTATASAIPWAANAAAQTGLKAVAARTILSAGTFGGAEAVNETMRQSQDEGQLDFGQIAKTGAHGAVLGAAMGPLGSYRAKVPASAGPVRMGLARAQQEAVRTGSEIGIFTADTALQEGRAPTAQDFALNTFMVGIMRAAGVFQHGPDSPYRRPPTEADIKRELRKLLGSPDPRVRVSVKDVLDGKMKVSELGRVLADHVSPELHAEVQAAQKAVEDAYAAGDAVALRRAEGRLEQAQASLERATAEVAAEYQGTMSRVAEQGPSPEPVPAVPRLRDQAAGDVAAEYNRIRREMESGTMTDLQVEDARMRLRELGAKLDEMGVPREEWAERGEAREREIVDREMAEAQQRSTAREQPAYPEQLQQERAAVQAEIDQLRAEIKEAPSSEKAELRRQLGAAIRRKRALEKAGQGEGVGERETGVVGEGGEPLTAEGAPDRPGTGRRERMTPEQREAEVEALRDQHTTVGRLLDERQGAVREAQEAVTEAELALKNAKGKKARAKAAKKLQDAQKKLREESRARQALEAERSRLELQLPSGEARDRAPGETQGSRRRVATVRRQADTLTEAVRGSDEAAAARAEELLSDPDPRIVAIARAVRDGNLPLDRVQERLAELAPETLNQEALDWASSVMAGTAAREGGPGRTAARRHLSTLGWKSWEIRELTSEQVARAVLRGETPESRPELRERLERRRRVRKWKSERDRMGRRNRPERGKPSKPPRVRPPKDEPPPPSEPPSEPPTGSDGGPAAGGGKGGGTSSPPSRRPPGEPPPDTSAKPPDAGPPTKRDEGPPKPESSRQEHPLDRKKPVELTDEEYDAEVVRLREAIETRDKLESFDRVIEDAEHPDTGNPLSEAQMVRLTERRDQLRSEFEKNWTERERNFIDTEVEPEWDWVLVESEIAATEKGGPPAKPREERRRVRPEDAGPRTDIEAALIVAEDPKLPLEMRRDAANEARRSIGAEIRLTDPANYDAGGAARSKVADAAKYNSERLRDLADRQMKVEAEIGQEMQKGGAKGESKPPAKPPAKGGKLPVGKGDPLPVRPNWVLIDGNRPDVPRERKIAAAEALAKYIEQNPDAAYHDTGSGYGNIWQVVLPDGKTVVGLQSERAWTDKATGTKHPATVRAFGAHVEGEGSFQSRSRDTLVEIERQLMGREPEPLREGATKADEQAWLDARREVNNIAHRIDEIGEARRNARGKRRKGLEEELDREHRRYQQHLKLASDLAKKIGEDRAAELWKEELNRNEKPATIPKETWQRTLDQHAQKVHGKVYDELTPAQKDSVHNDWAKAVKRALKAGEDVPENVAREFGVVPVQPTPAKPPAKPAKPARYFESSGWLMEPDGTLAGFKTIASAKKAAREAGANSPKPVRVGDLWRVQTFNQTLRGKGVPEAVQLRKGGTVKSDELMTRVLQAEAEAQPMGRREVRTMTSDLAEYVEDRWAAMHEMETTKSRERRVELEDRLVDLDTQITTKGDSDHIQRATDLRAALEEVTRTGVPAPPPHAAQRHRRWSDELEQRFRREDDNEKAQGLRPEGTGLSVSRVPADLPTFDSAQGYREYSQSVKAAVERERKRVGVAHEKEMDALASERRRAEADVEDAKIQYWEDNHGKWTIALENATDTTSGPNLRDRSPSGMVRKNFRNAMEQISDEGLREQILSAAVDYAAGARTAGLGHKKLRRVRVRNSPKHQEYTNQIASGERQMQEAQQRLDTVISQALKAGKHESEPVLRANLHPFIDVTSKKSPGEQIRAEQERMREFLKPHEDRKGLVTKSAMERWGEARERLQAWEELSREAQREADRLQAQATRKEQLQDANLFYDKAVTPYIDLTPSFKWEGTTKGWENVAAHLAQAIATPGRSEVPGMLQTVMEGKASLLDYANLIEGTTAAALEKSGLKAGLIDANGVLTSKGQKQVATMAAAMAATVRASSLKSPVYQLATKRWKSQFQPNDDVRYGLAVENAEGKNVHARIKSEEHGGTWITNGHFLLRVEPIKDTSFTKRINDQVADPSTVPKIDSVLKDAVDPSGTVKLEPVAHQTTEPGVVDRFGNGIVWLVGKGDGTENIWSLDANYFRGVKELYPDAEFRAKRIPSYDKPEKGVFVYQDGELVGIVMPKHPNFDGKAPLRQMLADAIAGGDVVLPRQPKSRMGVQDRTEMKDVLPGGEYMARRAPDRISADVNPEDAVRLLRHHVAGETQTIVTGAVKEGLQNAIDAQRLRNQVYPVEEIGGDPGGMIRVELYTGPSMHDGRRVLISDMGIGMTRSVVENEWVDALRTHMKGAGTGGSFGVANIGILGNADSIYLKTTAAPQESVTIPRSDPNRRAAELLVRKNTGWKLLADVPTRDGKSDVLTFVEKDPRWMEVTEVEGTGEGYMDPKVGLKIKSKRVPFDAAELGTDLDLTYRNPEKAASGLGDFLQMLDRAKHFSSVGFEVMESSFAERGANNVVLKPWTGGFTYSRKAKPDWSDAHVDRIKMENYDIEVHSTKAEERREAVSAPVLVNGIPQFEVAIGHGGAWGEKRLMPANIVINVRPKVGPEHESYPFKLDRSGFRSSERMAVSDGIRKVILDRVGNREVEMYRDVLEGGRAPELAGQTARGSARRGGPRRVIDVTQKLSDELLRDIAADEKLGRFTELLADGAERIADRLEKTWFSPEADIGNAAEFANVVAQGLAIGPGYYGANYRTMEIFGFPSKMGIDPRNRVVFNPFALVGDHLETVQAAGMNVNRWLADAMAGIAHHEIGHQVARGEAEGYRFMTFDHHGGKVREKVADELFVFLEANPEVVHAIKEFQDLAKSEYAFKSEDIFGTKRSEVGGVQQVLGVPGTPGQRSQAELGEGRAAGGPVGGREPGRAVREGGGPVRLDAAEGVPGRVDRPGAASAAAMRSSRTRAAQRQRRAASDAAKLGYVDLPGEPRPLQAGEAERFNQKAAAMKALGMHDAAREMRKWVAASQKLQGPVNKPAAPAKPKRRPTAFDKTRIEMPKEGRPLDEAEAALLAAAGGGSITPEGAAQLGRPGMGQEEFRNLHPAEKVVHLVRRIADAKDPRHVENIFLARKYESWNLPPSHFEALQAAAARRFNKATVAELPDGVRQKVQRIEGPAVGGIYDGKGDGAVRKWFFTGSPVRFVMKGLKDAKGREIFDDVNVGLRSAYQRMTHEWNLLNDLGQDLIFVTDRGRKIRSESLDDQIVFELLDNPEGNAAWIDRPTVKLANGKEVAVQGYHREAARLMSELFTELADLQGLPKNRRRQWYVTHVLEPTLNYQKATPENLKLIHALAKKALGKEYSADGVNQLLGSDLTIAEALQIRDALESVSKPKTMKGLRRKFDVVRGTDDPTIPKALRQPYLEKRTGLPHYKRSALAAYQAYLRYALRKIHLEPAIQNAREVIETLPGKGEHAPLSPVITQREYAEQAIAHLLGKPSKADVSVDRMLTRIAQLTNGRAARTFGLRWLFKPRLATRASAGVNRAQYFRLLGLAADSMITNMTQIGLTYAKHGFLHTAAGYMLLPVAVADGALSKAHLTQGRLWSKLHDAQLMSEFKSFFGGPQSLIKDPTGLIRHPLKRIEQIALSPFTFGEFVNRGAAFLAGLSHARSLGLSFERSWDLGMARTNKFLEAHAKGEYDALRKLSPAEKYARDAVIETQFGYSPAESAPVFGKPGGRVLFQFHSYPTQAATLFWDYTIRNMGRNGPHEAAVALRTLAIFGLYAGGGAYLLDKWFGIDARNLFHIRGWVPMSLGPNATLALDAGNALRGDWTSRAKLKQDYGSTPAEWVIPRAVKKVMGVTHKSLEGENPAYRVLPWRPSREEASGGSGGRGSRGGSRGSRGRDRGSR